MSFLKPKSVSTPTNQFAGQINSSYSPSVATGNTATNFIGQLLGVSPAGSGTSGPSSQQRISHLLSLGADNSGKAMQKHFMENPDDFEGIYALADPTEQAKYQKWAAANPSGEAGSGGSAFDAFEQYKKLAGYAPALSAMQSGVTQGAAAQGLLNSGASRKALLKKGAELDQQTFGNFLQQLAGLSGIGLQGGSLISGAGGVQNSKEPSTAGTIASTIGGIASIFSDRSMKRDIVKLDEMPDGLGIYSFRYFDEPTIRVGVMADEVERFRPWALGPKIGGFATVNYGAL